MLRDAAAIAPDKAALCQDDQVIRYGEWLRDACTFAAELHNGGFTHGDRLAILTPKCPEAIVAFLGANLAGGAAFTLDFQQTVADLNHILRLTRPAALLAATDMAPLLQTLISPRECRLIWLPQPPHAGRDAGWREILAHPRPAPACDPAPEDMAYLNFTSGTTGRPKAAVTTHANLYWNTRAAAECLQLCPEDVHLSLFPIYGHPHELFCRSLYFAATAVLVEGISPKNIANAVQRHDVTCMMAVASIYAGLLRQSNNREMALTSLRIAESGGMHLCPELAEAFNARFGISILPVWGSTETTGIALATRPEEGYQIGSMGRPCPYYEVDVLSETGDPAEAGAIGEMVVRGPGVCRAYWEQPDDTKLQMKNGAVFTGDLVRTDHQGRFYFADRKSRMIKVAGLKVYPSEVEDVLRQHPAVADAAVIKAESGTRGEAPKAVVVPLPDRQVCEQELRHHCESLLARHKVPRKFTFCDELPRTPTGKILYRLLQEKETLAYKGEPEE